MMKREIERTYAAQKLISYHGVRWRQRMQAIKGAAWAAAYLIVLAALALAAA